MSYHKSARGEQGFMILGQEEEGGITGVFFCLFHRLINQFSRSILLISRSNIDVRGNPKNIRVHEQDEDYSKLTRKALVLSFVVEKIFKNQVPYRLVHRR